MQKIIEVKNGLISIETVKNGKVIATYEVDLFDAAVREGLFTLGWQPPTNSYAGFRIFTLQVKDAEESKETKTESDAGEEILSTPHL